MKEFLLDERNDPLSDRWKDSLFDRRKGFPLYRRKAVQPVVLTLC